MLLSRKPSTLIWMPNRICPTLPRSHRVILEGIAVRIVIASFPAVIPCPNCHRPPRGLAAGEPDDRLRPAIR